MPLLAKLTITPWNQKISKSATANSARAMSTPSATNALLSEVKIGMRMSDRIQSGIL